MVIENFTPFQSLAGGILIGTSAVILMVFNGKIAGISGITKGIISHEYSTSHEKNWRIYFLAGLVLGGIIIIQLLPSVTASIAGFSPFKMIIAGLLVGIGTAAGTGELGAVQSVTDPRHGAVLDVGGVCPWGRAGLLLPLATGALRAGTDAHRPQPSGQCSGPRWS